MEIFKEVKRVLRPDGTLWLNYGDGYQDKQLLGMPWRVAFALQADGWWLRSAIVWAKGWDGDNEIYEELGAGSQMPGSQRDRPTGSYEFVFLLSRGAKYYYDDTAVKVDWPGGSHTLRNVWFISGRGFKGPHFAAFPEKLVEPCILAGCPEGGTVLDPFVGSGTTLVVAHRLGRNGIGIDISPEYIQMAEKRLRTLPVGTLL